MQSNSNLTPEEVLKTLDKALKKIAAATDRRAAEADRRAAEFNQRLEKSRAEAAERAAEADRRAAEADRRAAEFNQRLEKSRAEAAERDAEADRRAAEFDQRLEKSRAEAAERDAEADRRAAEFDQSLKKSRAEAAERAAAADKAAAERVAEAKIFDAEFKLKMQELRDAQADTALFLKKLGQQIGGVSNSNGDMAEEFFFNALYNGTRELFGEKFDDVIKDIKVGFKGNEDQYDVVLMNGRSTCVVEVKYKADSEDLPRKVTRKAQTFRRNFPQHSDKKVFLALAAMSINPLTEQACIDNGIAIIKQLGDTIAIHDENLKIF